MNHTKAPSVASPGAERNPDTRPVTSATPLTIMTVPFGSTRAKRIVLTRLHLGKFCQR